MRRFVLVRDVDVSGVSGTGAIVWGIAFPDGQVAYRWNTATATTSVADSIGDVETIHGHGGQTRLVWLDTPGDANRWRVFGEPVTGEFACGGEVTGGGTAG